MVESGLTLRSGPPTMAAAALPSDALGNFSVRSKGIGSMK
jgi:hypothetical protein